jgi:iron complex transport system permease protein
MRVALSMTVLAVLVMLSLGIGIIDLRSDPDALGLLMISRIPRTAAALIAGASLAIAGAILQMLVRNRFVEPMTAGTGQGAALGILVAILIFPQASILVKMIIASGTALVTSLGFLAMVQRLPTTRPLLVPLVGLIYGGLLGAVVTFIAYQADLLQGRYELLWIAAALALGAYFIADQFAIAGMGRTMSLNLGLNYRQVMTLGLCAIAVISALTVVTVGMIPFVGLVVPNIVSRLQGDNLRRTLPLTALGGAGAVLLCDVLGRVLRYPFEIPVGTVFGVIGAGVFLVLLYARPADVRP